MREGDLVFIELSSPAFKKVARASKSWASNMGIVLKQDAQSDELVGYDSTIPKVKKTSLCSFLNHTENNHFAVRRAQFSVSDQDLISMRTRANELIGELYDTGFDFESNCQFCSKYSGLPSLGDKLS